MGAINQTTLRANGGPLEIEIAFGHAHWAQYRLTLLNSAKQVIATIGEGANTDSVPDVFVLSPTAGLASLDGQFISFLAVVATYTPGQSQPFSTTLTLKQGGAVVPGGTITDTGTFDKAVYSVGITQLKVVV